MKIVKENLKSIIAFVIGVVLTGGIAVYATTYQASNINYTRNNTTMNVANALDDLYSKATELNTLKTNINQTNATANEILQGYKAYTTDGLITGNKVSVTKVLIGSNYSSRTEQPNIDITSKVANYQNLTADNFLIVNKSLEYDEPFDNNEGEFYNMSKSYNSSTGKLSLGKQISWYYSGSNFTKYGIFWNTYDVYCIY